MSSGRDEMMERWAEDYKLQQERNKVQMSFEFDYDALHERELNDYLDKTWTKPTDSYDPRMDTMEDWEDSRDTTPYNREQYGREDA